MPDRSRSRRKAGQFHKDNRGSTLVVVIVAMLLLCTLASIILYTTYVNYTIKTTELHSTDNFYTAETIMEEIKAGLELEVSNAYTDAYLFIMQNYNSGDEAGEVLRTANFQTRYINYLKDKLDPDRDEQLNPEQLYDYLSRIIKDEHGDIVLTAGEASFSDGSRAKLELVPADGKSLVAYTDGVWIKGLRLTYTDSSGYVAVITTDIALKIPNMTFEEQSSLPGVLSYSLIADKKLNFGVGSAGGGSVEGNVYGGSDGILINHSHAIFEGTYLVVTGGNVEISGTQNGDGSYDGGFTTSGNASLWADGIVVDSGELNLSGESYVQDDLTVNGRNSAVTLKGQYYGFGYQSVSTAPPVPGPENSSSILINGTGIRLDLSELTALGLAGQAFIGTTETDRDTNGDGIQDDSYILVEYIPVIGENGSITYVENETTYSTSENQTVRMGESLSVRSNQLAYLVPPECVGYIDGECVLGSNPITLSQYQEYVNQWNQWEAAHPEIRSEIRSEIRREHPEWNTVTVEERVNVAIEQLRLADEVKTEKAELFNGVTTMTLHDYGATGQKVFYQAAGTGNNAWVYYYLTFKSAADANAFFSDYYIQNKDWVNNYIGNYLSVYRVPSAIETLNLAGNAVFYDDYGDDDDSTGEFILQPASSSGETEDVLGLLAEYGRYSNTYKALNTNLTTNYAALTNDELGLKVDPVTGLVDDVAGIIVRDFNGDGRVSVFENIVDVQRLREYMGGASEKTVGADTGFSVLLIDNVGESIYTIPSGSKIKAVIATGDVKVTSDYNGMILSGGQIFVSGGARLKSSPDDVSLALQADNGQLLECFWEGKSMTGVPGGSPTPAPGEEETDVVGTDELVVYRNWKKD